MADYGLTETGINIKRLDEILEEMQTSLSDKWGVNVAQNPQSFLNVLLTDIADHLAELWELGQDVYYSQYPLSAEGEYLDGVGQFIGVYREFEVPSYYHILCTGLENTVISTTTVIASDTNPKVYLDASEEYVLSRNRFNIADIRVVSMDGNPFTVSINSNAVSYTPEEGETAGEALEELSRLISGDFTASYNADTSIMTVTANDVTSINTMVLSENLTTDTVGCVFTFETEEIGDIYLPAGSINEIITEVNGLRAVLNVGTYTAGRETETDTEFRQSYMDKIFNSSSTMAQSIKSGIEANCQGVDSVQVYQNDTNETDASGRPPHSIEVVCDGGDSNEIAMEIMDKKAAGITAYGQIYVDVPTEEGDLIRVGFSRPSSVNVWFRVSITTSLGETLPEDYAELIKEIITESVNELDLGHNVMPQMLILPQIYSNIMGIGYVEILMETGDTEPQTYTKQNIYLSETQKAITSEEKIEVVLDD